MYLITKMNTTKISAKFYQEVLQTLVMVLVMPRKGGG